MTLAFVPVSRGKLRSWATSGTLPGQTTGFAVTPAMQEAFGFSANASDEAEYTALVIAGVAALLVDDHRLVAVAESPVREGPVGLEAFGGVIVDDLVFTRVVAVFGDESSVEAGAVHTAIAGASLDDAWEHPAVEALLAGSDLLWHAADEWGTLC